ncbi:MAG: FAD-dependent oxidoreductase [Woeseiaceae bacterium]
MNRRTLLKLLAAASLAGCSGRESAAKGLRVVVAGAGIIGASIAYHLAKSGASVTVIDKQGPATHASRGTFAWINATWAKQPRHYHALNQDGLANWKVLQQSLQIPIRWNGSLEWFDSAAKQEKLVEQIAEQIEWGARARMVSAAELPALEPNVEFGDVQQVAFSENDGAVDPVMATRALLSAAEAMGAEIRYPCALTGVSPVSGRVSAVETSLGTIRADRLVLATGAEQGAGIQFAGVDIPQRSAPGIIAISAPTPRVLNRIIVAPGIHMHQRGDGRLVFGEQDGAPQNEAHSMRLTARPNEFPTRVIAEQHAERMLAVAKRFVPGIAGLGIDDVFIGWRPLPLDGHPVLGASPARRDVYLAIMHSGVSLAPIVGQLVAHEVLTGLAIDRLDEYRPDRTFEFVRRY